MHDIASDNLLFTEKGPPSSCMPLSDRPPMPEISPGGLQAEIGQKAGTRRNIIDFQDHFTRTAVAKSLR
jgi:hypothetical protein